MPPSSVALLSLLQSPHAPKKGGYPPGIDSVLIAVACIVEAFLLMGHATGELEKRGHDCIAVTSCLAAICTCWHLKSQSPWARVCVLYCVCVHGGIYVAMGLYLALGFNGEWGTNDPHMLHSSGMTLYVLITWTALLFVFIFVGRLSLSWARSNKWQYEQTQCVSSAACADMIGICDATSSPVDWQDA